jgi:hypothetical protein
MQMDADARCRMRNAECPVLMLTQFSRLKLKRPQTAKMYRKVLDDLYAESHAGKAKL